MPSYCNILIVLGIVITTSGYKAIASDFNPWSMDQSSAERQPYYNLNGQGGSRFFRPDQGVVGQKGPPKGQKALVPGNGLNESVIPKSPAFAGEKGWKSGPGKGHRDEYFGYAGPPPEVDRGAAVARENGGVQFEGRTYGAFPPLEEKPAARARSQGWPVSGGGQKRQPRQSPAFANVLPAPIAEPLPERAYPYPYSGYGVIPGYGAPVGTRVAPRYGNNGLGIGGLGYGGLGAGAGYPLSPVDPGMLGFPMPGFMW